MHIYKHIWPLSDASLRAQLWASLASPWSRGPPRCARGSLSAFSAKWAVMQWNQWSGKEPTTKRCKVRGARVGKKMDIWEFSPTFFLLIDNVKIGPGGSVLTITNARPGNQGQYRCTVQTAAGRKSATAALNVKCELQVFHHLIRNNI